MNTTYWFRTLVLVLSLTVLLSQSARSQQTDSAANNTADAPAASNERHTPDPRQEQMAELARSQSPDTEVEWLETKLEAFLGLYHPANTADPLGGALILHHDRTSPDWPTIVHDLRTQLPNQDWHTLAIAMPDEPQPQAPIRGESDVANAEPPGTPAPDSFKDQIFERMDSAIQHLQSQDPERLLLIGIGTGGYWASYYLSEKDLTGKALLVLIDARPPIQTKEISLEEAVAKIEVPTADLLHGSLPDQRLMETLAQRRANQAKREARPFYLQRTLPGRPSLDNSQVLMNTLRGVVVERLLKMEFQPAQPSDSNAANLKPGN